MLAVYVSFLNFSKQAVEKAQSSSSSETEIRAQQSTHSSYDVKRSHSSVHARRTRYGTAVAAASRRTEEENRRAPAAERARELIFCCLFDFSLTNSHKPGKPGKQAGTYSSTCIQYTVYMHHADSTLSKDKFRIITSIKLLSATEATNTTYNK